MFQRVIVIILDGVGIGKTHDSHLYGDEGSDTLRNLNKKRPLNIPNLSSLGLSVLIPELGKNENIMGSYGIMHPKSAGKDSTSGHWEIFGVILEKPFPVYPDGFPQEIVKEFEKRIGRKILWNKPASGTEIINLLGEAHLKTGYPILYTSADSVFQIACHEDIIPKEELYKMCEIAREILQGEHGVCRVIARPFRGEKGNFRRTEGRRDYSLPPPYPTLLDKMIGRGMRVLGIGKVKDIMGGTGFSEVFLTKNNREGMEKIEKTTKNSNFHLLVANLIDFDMVWGHRNDIEGFAKSLEEFDSFVPEILNSLKENDLLFITADHGNDPTTPSTDHSRESVPILIYGKRAQKRVNIGIRKSFSDLGKTIGENFGIEMKNGESFLKLINYNSASLVNK
ncbi:MAG: phosphopentomutase [Candidatus Aminicenantia bacterium]